MSDVETPISLVELRLAARNHAMPLEALRYPITPAGPPLPAHPLRHPGRRPGDLAAGGRTASSATPLSLSLDELRARPARGAARDHGVRRQRARAARAARRSASRG